MKILIWFLCILANALLTTILKLCGIFLGFLPTILMYSGTLWLAQTLCTKWDAHKKAKKNASASTSQYDVTTSHQIRFCRKCGEQLIDNSLFCRTCGTEILKEF